ncbi:MAG: 50S ribosomal protein L1 [Planctomycetota bacterium]
MTRISKRHKANLGHTTETIATTVADAVANLKKFQNAKFDETIEIAIRTGIDPKQTAQAIRGSYSLPHGIGKKVRVIAFCDGDAATQAVEAGAIEAGSEELVKKVEGGWFDFDVAIAHPSMMRFVGKLGRVLGPQGKMPAPKAGTVTPDVAGAVKEFAAGKISFRNDEGANIHAPMGKKSFSNEQLTDNINAFLEHIESLKPTSAKGVFIRKVIIKSTMSPAVPIAISA